MPKTIALIVAAGASSRLPGDRPKPYRLLAGRPVLCYSVQTYATHPAVEAVAVVMHPAHRALYEEAMAPVAATLEERMGEGAPPLLPAIEGGATRQESVRLGLDALAPYGPDTVLIHDAARPGLTHGLIDRILAGLQEAPAAVPAMPVNDTIKQVADDRVTTTLNRAQLAAVQTPQGFAYDTIRALHASHAAEAFTDDAALAEAAGLEVRIVAGEAMNFKLTTPEDWQRMEQMADTRFSPPHTQTRTGMGFDVHRLIEDSARPLMICGVEIPGQWALEGHSDADVGLHALTDALLGALAAGDIGEHFSPSDPRWENADSAEFVRETMQLVGQRQCRVVHADITLIAERPKMAPHRTAMRETVANMLNIDRSGVSIKATTTEGLGFTGRGEGIAAQAVVTISG